MIRSLRYSGVKGRSFRFAPLPRRAILVGPPGAGKSAALEALRFAAAACSPALGKDESSLARLMPDAAESMGVAVELADGRAWTRLLQRDGKKIGLTSTATWLPPESTSTAAHGTAIRALFGASDEEARQHVDIRALLSAAPGERMRYVSALLERPNAGAVLAARARALAWAKAGEWKRPIPPDAAAGTDAGTAAFVDFLRKNAVTPGEAAAVEAVERETLPVLASQGLAAALAAARKAKGDAEGDARGKVAARAEIEAREASAGAVSGDLDGLRARREALDREIGAAKADGEAHDRFLTAYEAARRRHLDAEKALADAVARAAEAPHRREQAASERKAAAETVDPVRPAPPAAVEPDAAKIAEAVRLEAEVVAYGRIVPPDGKAFDAAKTESDARQAALAAATRKREAFAERLAHEEAALLLARQSPWAKVREIAKGMRADLAYYPNIGGTAVERAIEGWAAALDAAAADVPTVEHHETIIAEAKKSVAWAVEQEKEAEKAHAASERLAATESATWKAEADHRLNLIDERAAKAHAAKKLRDDAAAAAKLANTAAAVAHKKALEEYDKAVDHNKRGREFRESIARRNIELADDLENAVAPLRSTATEAKAALDAVGESPPRTDFAMRRDAAETALTTVAASLEALEAAHARSREMGSLALAIAEAEARAKAAGCFAWALDQLRQEELTKLGGPLTDRLSAYLVACGRREVPYLRASRSGPEIGWRDGENEVGVETLSGTESTIFLAGLAGAVIEIRKPDVRALLVDADRLGNARLEAQQMLSGLATLDVHHVIVAAPPSVYDWQAEGWETVRVEAA